VNRFQRGISKVVEIIRQPPPIGSIIAQLRRKVKDLVGEQPIKGFPSMHRSNLNLARGKQALNSIGTVCDDGGTASTATISLTSR